MPKNVKNIILIRSQYRTGTRYHRLGSRCCFDSRSKSSSPHHPPMLKLMKKGVCWRCSHRPKEVVFETSHPTTRRADIRSRWNHSLLCSQYSRSIYHGFCFGAKANATLPFTPSSCLIWDGKKAWPTDSGLKKALNIKPRKIVFPAVTEAFGWKNIIPKEAMC